MFSKRKMTQVGNFVKWAVQEWDAQPKGRKGPVGWESYQGLDVAEANHMAIKFNKMPKALRQFYLDNGLDLFPRVFVENHHPSCRHRKDGPYAIGHTVRCPDCDYHEKLDAAKEAASPGQKLDHFVDNRPGQPIVAVYTDGTEKVVEW